MLTRLYIENFALIERVEVEFGPGLNVVTGETGAGKSVLLGALDSILGGAASADCVRAGLGDERYSYPRALLGASRAQILALVEEMSKIFSQNIKMMKVDGETETTGRFRQSEDYDAEILGEDLILMNNRTREVLTLNPTARAVWELLEEGLSRDEIGEAFHEACADMDGAVLGKDIDRTLEHLLASGLISHDEDAA